MLLKDELARDAGDTTDQWHGSVHQVLEDPARHRLAVEDEVDLARAGRKVDHPLRVRPP